MAAAQPGQQHGLLGRLAVHLKLISMDQLAAATAAQGLKPNLRLGEILIEKGFINEAQLTDLLAKQKVYLEKRRSQKVAPPKRSQAAIAAPDTRALGQILEKALSMHATDVQIHCDGPVMLRVDGQLSPRTQSFPRAQAEKVVMSALTEAARKRLDAVGQADFSFEMAGRARFRCNVFRHRRGVDLSMRHIPPSPPSLEELSLPHDLASLTTYPQGLVLFTGPSGCGKSTTMAALLDIINQERRDHILTVEDPVEFVHPTKRCLVNQREVGVHTDSFAAALRGALREDPDIIVIGELRDLETISLALTAAETGHLVLATMHTNSAIATLNRLVGSFPPKQQNQVRSMVSESLRAVVVQKLARRRDGRGRVPALEVLKVTPAVGNIIREGKTFTLDTVMQTGVKQGMCLMDSSLQHLLQSGEIDATEARRLADDPKKIQG